MNEGSRGGLSERALIVLLAFVITIGSISTNVYIPALPAVRAHFGASVGEVQATFSVALVTFALGMLCWGPIGDRYGRRRAILAGVGVMAAGSVVCLTATSLTALIVGRAVLSFGTATGIAVSRAIVSDLFPAERMARMLAQQGVIAVVASGLAPTLGGFLTAGLGWRSVFAVLIVAAAAVGWTTWRYLPETRPATRTPPDLAEMGSVAVSLLRKPLYVGCVSQVATSYAMFVVLVSLAPYVMVSVLGRGPTEYGFYYLFVAGGYVLGNASIGRLSGLGQHRTVALGTGLQLVAACVALAFVAAGLRHPLWIFVPMAVLYFGQGLFVPHLTAVAVSLAPAHATGVSSSTLGFVTQVFAAICVQAMGALGGSASALPMLAFGAGAAVVQLGLFVGFPRIEAPPRPA